MKNLFFLAAVFSLVMSAISCKSKKEASGSSATAATAATTSTEEPVNQTYRLTVSFISKGAGTDSEKRNAFMAYINAHPKKPAYKLMPWGREGEADYCFTLSELDSKKELTDFIEGIRKISAGSDMMQVTENASYVPKGRR